MCLRSALLSCTALLIISSVLAYDMDVTRVKEEFGEWRVSFNWSAMSDYSRSVSHGESESGRTKTSTDTLIMTSAEDASRVVKVSVITYPRDDSGLSGLQAISEAANETLKKSGACGSISTSELQVQGRTGILASGERCPHGGDLYAASFPVEHHLDGPGGVLGSSAMAVVLSTYDWEMTRRLLQSIAIEQVR